MTTTKGIKRERSNDKYNSLPPTSLSEVAELSFYELTISVIFGGKEAVATAVGYTKLAISFFAQVCHLVPVFLSLVHR